MQLELGHELDFAEVADKLKTHLAELFEMTFELPRML
jgi:hypothetical protein